MLLAMAAGGIIGAMIADATGARKVVFGSLLLTAPMTFLFLLSSGLVTVIALLLAGVLMGASTSVTLVMGQELMPRNGGVVSGLIMGLAFAAGGAGAGLTGEMALHVGLMESLYVVAALPLVAAVLSLALRKPARRLDDTLVG
jgi:FSR family fosmidomycin resistance protein-like MFS transporter